MFTNNNTAAMDRTERTWPFIITLAALPVVTVVGTIVVVGSVKDK